MNDKDLLSLIINEMKMTVSAHDAIYYITNEFIDSKLVEEFIENSITLIKLISLNHSNIEKEELELLQGLESSATNVSLLFKKWLVVVNNDLFEAIFSLIRNSYDFSADEMKSIIEYILLIRYNDVIKFQRLFGFLTSAGHLLPMETFGIGMYMLEIYGFLKTNSKLHPNYKYDPKTDIQHEFRECTICGCNQTTPQITVYSFVSQNFSKPEMPFKLYLRCENCGNCFSKYSSSQRFKRNVENKFIIPINEKVSLQSFDMRKLSYVSEVLSKVKKLNCNKEFLNIGVGKGEILATALEYGYNVEAVEILEDKAQKVADILQIPINNCEFIEFETDKQYSTIFIEYFLEFEFNIDKIFRKIHHLLEDDGVLWISTPNYNSAFSRLTRERCELWKNPLNLTLFDKCGLEKILQQHGFKAVDYNISRSNNGYMEMLVQKV